MIYNLYDFDGTVYKHECESRFYMFCILHRPYILLLLPYQLICVLLRYTTKERIKWMSRFFCFLRFVNGKKLAERFWQKEQHNIRDFFAAKKRAYPAVICSESPEFLLEPICRTYNVDILIATKLNSKTGRNIGDIMRGKNKLDAINMALPNAEIHSAYTDKPILDMPMVSPAKHKFHVHKNGKITEFEQIIWRKNSHDY